MYMGDNRWKEKEEIEGNERCVPGGSRNTQEIRKRNIFGLQVLQVYLIKLIPMRSCALLVLCTDDRYHPHPSPQILDMFRISIPSLQDYFGIIFLFFCRKFSIWGWVSI